MDTYNSDHQNQFIRSYLACAAWCGVPEEDRDGGEFTVDDFSAEAATRAQNECHDFLAQVPAGVLNDWSPEQAGHDFWLTRNGHGAGFWDRGHGDAGRTLTELAHTAGSCDCYLNDKGEIDFA